jgi:hypothetical protein
MSTRLLALTAVLSAGATVALAVVAAAPALGQGDPVYGVGNTYYLSGAYNDDGLAQDVFAFGDPEDEVYFGDWYGDGLDLPMVRRGNVFFVPDQSDPSVTATVFAYGNDDDEIYVGDWDGDGTDSLAVRRGNVYFVKNDVQRSGVADRVFAYGDPDDYVIVGNWDGEVVAPTTDAPGKGDTLTVVRNNHFFVKNTISTGVADYTFYFGNPEDELLVGDWALVADNGDGTETVSSGNDADQVAVVRGNQFHLSGEFESAQHEGGLSTQRVLAYGDPDDAVFVASLPTALDADGAVADGDTAVVVIEGDGLGVRRTH